MIPNNNLSVLPWYTSIEQQNARKWWVYGRVYPLFTPAMFMLPFQIMREPRRETIYEPGEQIQPLGYEAGYITDTGEIELWPDSSTMEIDLQGVSRLYVENLPIGRYGPNIAFFDQDFHLIEVANIHGTGQYYTGDVAKPVDCYWAYVLARTSEYAPQTCKVYEANAIEIPQQIHQFLVYDKTGILVGDFTQQLIDAGLTIKPFADYDVIVFGGQWPIFTEFANGQYYATLSDGVETWYSEIFTVVNDIQPYLKIVWYDTEDFVMDAGVIVYRSNMGQFKNVLYLMADIAKPEYQFEEEGETRDGYFFPVKQISEKRYHFSFFAPEYLLDVMRFIRMSDFAYIEKNGQRYNLDTFLITPEWEDNGDVAAVDAEFDTATVAKKIGRGYEKGGSFNKDYNKDFKV